MADAQYTSSFDDSDVLKALNRIEKAIKATGKASEREFGKVDKSAVKMGASVGAVSGVVQSLVTEFIELGARAVDALVGIAAKAVELNKEAELTRISVTQIFGGNEAAADAFLARVKDTAVLLGANRQELQQIAKGILPDIGDVDTTIDFLESVVILGRDAGQSFQSIRIAAEEALSGNLNSLQRRLNIPKSVLDNIERYAENMSFADAVTKGLQERVEATGLSAESTAASLAVVQGQLQSQLQDLQIAFGAPLADEIKEQILSIGESLKDNNPAIEDAAIAFGDLLALITDFVGTEVDEFLQGIDFQTVEQLADALSRATNAGLLLVDVLLQTESANGTIERLITVVDALAVTIEKVAIALDFLAPALDIAPATINPLGNAVGLVFGQISTESEKSSESVDQLTNAMERYERRNTELAQAQMRRKEVTEATNQAEIDAAEAMLKSAKVVDQLAQATEDVADKEAELGRKREQATEQSLRRLVKLEIEQGEARTEALIRQSEDRVQAERDNARERESILFKFNQDLNRLQSQDDGTARITRENGRKRAEVDRDLANERIQIERDYQNEIRRIQQSFEQSAVSAASNVDAQAFLAAQRQRDNDLQSARLNRDNQVADAELAAQQQREALKVELQNEIADAREAHQKKLADLRQRLEDELAAQAFKEQQDAQRQADIDAQELVRLDRQQALELERFNRSEAEKQLRLEESLQKQVDALSEAKQKEIDLTQQAEKLKADIAIAEAQRAQAEISRIRQQSSVARTNVRTGRTSGLGGGIPRQFGGPVTAGQRYLVGEAGPEEFVPRTNGTIIPNDQLYRPAAALFGGGVTNQTTNNNEINMGLTPNMVNNPEMQLMIDQMVSRSFQRLLG